MKIIILFIILFQFCHVNADEIYNLIKIPNLEIYKLKNENNIRYLSAKGDFKIGVDNNITCNKTNQQNLNTKFHHILLLVRLINVFCKNLLFRSLLTQENL